MPLRNERWLKVKIGEVGVFALLDHTNSVELDFMWIIPMSESSSRLNIHGRNITLIISKDYAMIRS